MDHLRQHFNAPACKHKANAECLRCGVLRCFKHIHLSLDGMYKSLCNYCYHVDTYSAQALCISRVTASLQPYTQDQLQKMIDRRFCPRTTIRKAVDMFVHQHGRAAVSDHHLGVFRVGEGVRTVEEGHVHEEMLIRRPCREHLAVEGEQQGVGTQVLLSGGEWGCGG